MQRRKEQKPKGKPKGPSQPKRKNPAAKERAYNTMRNQQAQRWRAETESPQKQVGVSAAYATGQTGQGAKIVASRDTCRVAHREFIGNVAGTTAFAVASTFALNPGLAASFPWLSGIAQNWETYRFKRVRFCYYTRTGSNIPGSVIMAHDPDSSDAAPSTEQIMTTYESCKEDAPWKDICLPLRPTSLHEGQQRKFVRTGVLAANEDIKLYDSGNLFIATVDGTAVSWGKLWVEYDIEFETPQLPPAGASSAGVASSAATTIAAPGQNLVPLGPVGISFVGTTMTATNLIVGAEYILAYFCITAGGNNTAGTFVGATLKTSFTVGAAGSATGYSVTATANTMTCVWTLGATATDVVVTMALVPTVPY